MIKTDSENNNKDKNSLNEIPSMFLLILCLVYTK